MPELTHKVKALDEILALSAKVSQQENQVGVPNSMLNGNQTPDANPAGVNQAYILHIDSLIPFKSHPFKLYEGMRFEDMLLSIKTNGVLLPLIVRPIDGYTYEVLSGHNRVKAAKAAGLAAVPAIVREGLSDDEALLIVTETNLFQRSFSDLSHSERALVLSTHYDAIKKQGRKIELINDIENLLKAHVTNVSELGTPMASRQKSTEIIGEKYGLCHDNVARYIRINMLINDIKDRIDNNEIAIRSGVSLSYLPDLQQEIVEDVLCDGNYKIDMNKAEALRMASEKKPLIHENVEDILKGSKKTKPAYSTGIKIQPRIISKYFQPDQKKAEIEKTIEIALEFYYSSHSKKGDTLPNGDKSLSSNDQTGEALLSESNIV